LYRRRYVTVKERALAADPPAAGISQSSFLWKSTAAYKRLWTLGKEGIEDSYWLAEFKAIFECPKKGYPQIDP